MIKIIKSITTNNSSNWNTAYTYSQVGHLPLAGGSLAGNIVMGGNQIKFADAGRLYLGDSNDLQIYHDGSNSYIIDAGTGGLTIQANADFALQSTGTNENFITAATNAFVKLYFNGNEKLATTNTGVSVTGNSDISGEVQVGSAGSRFAENKLISRFCRRIFHGTSGISRKLLQVTLLSGFTQNISRKMPIMKCRSQVNSVLSRG